MVAAISDMFAHQLDTAFNILFFYHFKQRRSTTRDTIFCPRAFVAFEASPTTPLFEISFTKSMETLTNGPLWCASYLIDMKNEKNFHNRVQFF